MGEATGITSSALALLERVARSRRLVRTRGDGVGVVAEAAGVAAGALALLESVARGGGPRGGGRVGVVAEAAGITASAFAPLERVARGGAEATAAATAVAAAAAAAALRVAEAAGVAAGPLAPLERVADGSTGGSLAEARLLGVLAFSASRGLVLPSLALVKLLLAGGEDELGVAVAAVEGDVLKRGLGELVGLAGGLLMNLELLRMRLNEDGETGVASAVYSVCVRHVEKSFFLYFF